MNLYKKSVIKSMVSNNLNQSHVMAGTTNPLTSEMAHLFKCENHSVLFTFKIPWWSVSLQLFSNASS